jgi:hypothetical protein
MKFTYPLLSRSQCLSYGGDNGKYIYLDSNPCMQDFLGLSLQEEHTFVFTNFFRDTPLGEVLRVRQTNGRTFGYYIYSDINNNNYNYFIVFILCKYS